MQSEEMTVAIQRLEEKLQKQLEQVRKTKSAINALCEADDEPPRYTDIEQGGATGKIRSDQFYGQPLATCVRTILEMRRGAQLGAASVNEIFDALAAGGYAFETKNEDNAKTGLRQSLRKNSVFHKVPGGQWGLLSWYPNARVEKNADDDEDEDKGSPATNGSVKEGQAAPPVVAPARRPGPPTLTRPAKLSPSDPYGPAKIEMDPT
jgi:hypothetical protein